jgi:hypothetical protein
MPTLFPIIFNNCGQMVDKVWYDWQHRNPNNFWAFRGGSVAQNSTQYLNGSPPWMTVSANISIPEILFSLIFLFRLPFFRILFNWS